MVEPRQVTAELSFDVESCAKGLGQIKYEIPSWHYSHTRLIFVGNEVSEHVSDIVNLGVKLIGDSASGAIQAIMHLLVCQHWRD